MYQAKKDRKKPHAEYFDSREAYIRKLREKNMPLKLRDAVMEVLNLD